MYYLKELIELKSIPKNTEFLVDYLYFLVKFPNIALIITIFHCSFNFSATKSQFLVLNLPLKGTVYQTSSDSP